MAVDRGGLQYRITVKDEFSVTTKRFRNELAASKKAFRDFQGDLRSQREGAKALKATADAARDLTKATQARSQTSRRSATVEVDAAKQQVQALKGLAQAQRQREQTSKRISTAMRRDEEANRKAIEASARAASKAASEQAKAASALQREQQRALQASARAQQAREREASRISRQMRADAEANQRALEKLESQRARAEAASLKKSQQRDPAFQAQRQLNQQLFEEEVTRRKIALLRERASAQFRGGDFLGGRRTLNEAKELERSTAGIAKNSSNIFFSFRRLIGILAVFTLARQGVAAFTQLLTLGVKFNDQIRAAEIGIAGIVVATGDVRDEFGKSVDASQELVLAQQLAREQIRALRQDALRTTATFEQLLDTFQVAVAPGLAAGLNLDEIRKLSVSISQAATAIGLPQNQLAEEIRSLLSGTIQARTTRIATALGISNADIKRLKETGELFDFLEEKFAGFAEAAEKQARSTLSGIRTLVAGAVEELLGQVAEPFFKELLTLGTALFDEVLTIRDAAGGLAPNPKAVEAFQGLFNVLANGVRLLREFGSGIGFDGLKNILDSVATGLAAGLEFALGFAEGLLAALNVVVDTVRSIADIFGISNQNLGQVAGVLGTVVALVFVWNNTLGLLGVNLTNVLGIISKLPGALFPLLGIVLAVLQGFKLIFREVTGLENFGFIDTIEAIKLSFKELFATVSTSAKVFGKELANDLLRLFTDPIGFLADQINDLLGLLSGVAAVLPGVSEDVRQKIESASEALSRFQGGRGKGFQFFSQESIDADKRRLREIQEESQKAFQTLFNKVAGRKDGNSDIFSGLTTGLDKFIDSLKGKFTPVVSTAANDIAKLAGAALELSKELQEAQIAFDAAAAPTGGSGVGGKIQGFFTEQEIENAKRLREIRAQLADSERTIAQLVFQQASGFSLSAQQVAVLNSALQDQAQLSSAISEFEAESVRLAVLKAATVARQELPGLREENRLATLQAAQEKELADAVARRLDPRQQEALLARQAVETARLESQIKSEQLGAEIAIVAARAAQATDPEQKAALEALLEALRERKALEEAIATAKGVQLEKQKEQAELEANGSLGQGSLEGFKQLAEELPTAFEAGVAIVKQSTQSLAQFISSEIVNAFDPTAKEGLEERFARFLQGIANIILQQLIQTAIQAGLQAIIQKQQGAVVETTAAAQAGGIRVAAASEAAAIEVTAAQTAAAIRAASSAAGANRGGLVGRNRGGAIPSLHETVRAVGLARGGPPPGISPKDTVNTWLTPGEFVMRKAAVDHFGLNFMQALNRGNLPVASASAGVGAVADGAQGLATGGLVSDRAEAQSSRNPDSQTVLPVLVAKEREAERIFQGGRNSFLRFSRENAQPINASLRRRRKE